MASRRTTRRTMFAALVAATAGLGVTACLDIDRLASWPAADDRDDGGPSGGSGDGGAGADSPLSDGSALVELLENGDFESAGPPCAPWQGYAFPLPDGQAVLTRAGAHTGASSCQVCGFRLTYEK